MKLVDLFMVSVVVPQVINTIMKLEEENGVFNYASFNEKISRKSESSINDEKYLLCPEGFKVHYKTVALCYLITDEQEFPPKCPFPFTYSMEKVIQADIDEIQRFPVWMMIQRTASTKNDFNPFQSIDKDFMYKNDIYNYTAVANFLEKNCMTFFDNSITPARCTSKHKRVCAYPYPKGKYCETHFAPNVCVGVSLNIEKHKCYCESAESQASKNILNSITSHPSSCATLTEPLEGFESMILTNYFPTTFPLCLFGLHLLPGETKWVTSNVTVPYNYWAKNIINESLGALMFKNPEKPYGWVLADDDKNKSISCGICECEMNNQYSKNVSVDLSYDSIYNNIYILVENAIEISDYFGEYIALYCFIGPTTAGFKEKYPNIPINLNDMQPGNVNNTYSLMFKNQYRYPVYYWCETFQHPEIIPIYSNKILLQYNNTNNTFSEYAMRVKVQTRKNFDPYWEKLQDKVCDIIRSVISEKYGNTLRVMQVLNYDRIDYQMELLMHLTTPKGLENPIDEYTSLNRLLNAALYHRIILNITHVARSDFCLSSTTYFDGKLLHWPHTLLGRTTTALNACLQINGMPVTRTCEGDFLHGAIWSDVCGKCLTQSDGKVKDLQDLLQNTELTPAEISGNLSLISEDTKNVSSFEIHLMSEIVAKLERYDDGVPSDNIVTIVNNIMHYDSCILKESQNRRNSTDHILASFDGILTKLALQGHSFTINKSKLHVLVSNVKIADITTGLLIQHNEEGRFETIPLHSNTSLDIILQKHFVLGAFLPTETVQELKTCAEGTSSRINLIMSIFNDCVLFNEDTTNDSKMISRVVSILVTTNCTITKPILVVFKSLENHLLEKQCAYWRYGMDIKMEKNLTGTWKQDGTAVTYRTNHSSYYIVCEYTHLTHFALLMLDPNITIDEESVLALDIITAIGSCLSLCSILIIFGIAAANRRWRARTSNKILINFSLALALQMIFLFIAGDAAVDKDSLWCTLTGASLHYSILSEFLWMLVIGILQYKKFVIVFSTQTPHLVAKACALCWGLPFIPITVMLTISNECYEKNAHGLCYPAQYFFYFGLVCPVSAIVAVNIFLFFRIIFAVCCTKIEAHSPRENIIKLKVLLAVVLFFLLGMSWIFGLASGFGGGILFAYLFCITATINGLVIILVFLLMRETS